MMKRKGGNNSSRRILMYCWAASAVTSAANQSKHNVLLRHPIFTYSSVTAFSSRGASSSNQKPNARSNLRNDLIAPVSYNNDCHDKQIMYAVSEIKSTHTSQQHDLNDDIISHPKQKRQLRIPKSNTSLIERRISDLISHPAVQWDDSTTFASMYKKKLGRRHLHLFDRKRTTEGDVITKNVANDYRFQDQLFDQFASTVCQAGVIARKEVFETWASALHIHYNFLTDCNVAISSSSKSNSSSPIKRVVDVAAGHGLLAWALLLLSDDEERNRNKNKNTPSFLTSRTEQQQQRPLTVFCLDVQMPPSAEIIISSMIRQWPHLEDRFDYVEARLEQLVPHPSCLLASVHACGVLSDVLVATAAEHQMPLALVPCCHSSRRKSLEECASSFAKREYDAILNSEKTLPNLVDLLDAARKAALENAGFDVMEAYIPEIFTGKNRLIMGRPPYTRLDATNDDSSISLSDEKAKRPSPSSLLKGHMPPLLKNEISKTATTINPKARFMKGFYVPCADTKQSRTFLSNIAGRVAANRRKKLMHNRNHVNAPQFDLSMWLPQVDVDLKDDVRVLLSAESLSILLKTSIPEYVKCEVSQLGDVYIDPTDGRKSQSFRVQYKHVDDGEIISFDDAKILHDQLRDAVPFTFYGVECR